MKKLLAALALLSLTACGVVDTGNVGIRTTLGKVNMEEVTPGLYFVLPIFQGVDEYSAKEIHIQLNNLTPKAQDNLSLKDLDVSVFYKVAASKVAETRVKYANKGEYSTEAGAYLPASDMVTAVARNIVYEETSKVDSLIMHTKRDILASAIRKGLQDELESSDKGVFTVTRVVIRALATDTSIEQAIREAVANQKKLEAMKVKVDIAEQEAQIEIKKAEGVAKANKIVANGLGGPEGYLRYLWIQGMQTNNMQVVYIPTEAGLPLLEAGKRVK